MRPSRSGSSGRYAVSCAAVDGGGQSKADGTGAVRSRQVADLHSNFGAFKVPPLRGLTRTAPYFHNGSKATLADAARHYAQFDPDRLHSDGEKFLEPLGFSDREIEDLVAFLQPLSD